MEATERINEQSCNVNEEDGEEDDHDDLMREDLRFILQNDIDYVIHSAYQSHHEIIDLRAAIKQEA